MTVRRILVVAITLLIMWAAPAAADHSYSHVLGVEQTRTAVDTGPVQAQSSTPRAGGARTGALASTGSDTLVPLAQGALVLVGLGSLLALVGRRRRSQRQLTTA